MNDEIDKSKCCIILKENTEKIEELDVCIHTKCHNWFLFAIFNENCCYGCKDLQTKKIKIKYNEKDLRE